MKRSAAYLISSFCFFMLAVVMPSRFVSSQNVLRAESLPAFDSVQQSSPLCAATSEQIDSEITNLSFNLATYSRPLTSSRFISISHGQGETTSITSDLYGNIFLEQSLKKKVRSVFKLSDPTLNEGMDFSIDFKKAGLISIRVNSTEIAKSNLVDTLIETVSIPFVSPYTLCVGEVTKSSTFVVTDLKLVAYGPESNVDLWMVRLLLLLLSLYLWVFPFRAKSEKNRSARDISNGIDPESQLSLMAKTFWIAQGVFAFLIAVSLIFYKHGTLSELVVFKNADLPRTLPSITYPKPFHGHFFGDYLIPYRLSQLSTPYIAPGYIIYAYLPFSSVIIGPLLLFNYWTSLILFFTVFGIILLYFWYRSIRMNASRKTALRTVLVLLVSNGFLSTLNRGNLGLAVTLFCLLGAYFYLTNKTGVSMIFFGLAGAMKLYPILFLGLSLKNRKWKDFLGGVGAFVLGTFLPLLFYSGGFGRNIQALLQQFTQSSNSAHALTIQAYNNSPYALFLSLKSSGFPLFTTLGEFLAGNYYLILGIFCCFFLVLAIFSKITTFDSALIFTSIMCFLPNIVGGYVLLLMFVPIVFLEPISLSVKKTLVRKTQLITLAILFTSKGSTFFLPSSPWSPTISTFTSILNPLCFFVLMILCALTLDIPRRQRVRQCN